MRRSERYLWTPNPMTYCWHYIHVPLSHIAIEISTSAPIPAVPVTGTLSGRAEENTLSSGEDELYLVVANYHQIKDDEIDLNNGDVILVMYVLSQYR